MEQYHSELDRLNVDRAGKEALVQWLVEGETSSIRQTRRPTHALRPALIAACLALLLALGAVAAGLNGAWQRFFYGSVGDNVTQVGASATTGDYTLTLEEAIVDEDGVAFLLALTRTDGGVLEGKPRLSGNVFHWDVQVDGAYPNMGMTQQEPILSQDGKTIYYCMEFQAESLKEGESLLGREITFVCRGVADMDWTQEELDQVRTETVSLAPMVGAVQEVEQGWDDLFTDVETRMESLRRLAEEMVGRQIPLALGDGQVAHVSGVVFTAHGPAVAVDWLVDRYMEGQYLAVNAFPIRLTNTRTGESWGNSQGVATGTFASVALFEDCPLTAEELSYLELTVGYRMEKVLSDERTELTFLAEKGGGVTRELDQMVDYDDFYYEGRIDRARLSPLGIRLYMKNAGRVGSFDLEGRLVMKDGSALSLLLNQLRIDPDRGQGWVDLTFCNDQGERALIDPAQVKTLVLGECEVELG